MNLEQLKEQYEKLGQEIAKLELRCITLFEAGFDRAQREPEDGRLRVKLDGSYGAELEGHWFYIVPADEWAELALSTHTKTPNEKVSGPAKASS